MTNSVYVPIQLDAMVINKNNTDKQDFRSWTYNYSNLDEFTSPVSDAGKNYSDPPSGVYLHWLLPRSLRTQPQGSTRYPLVPNRWLVTRVSNGTPRPRRGWVVESDCPNSNQGVPYLLDRAVLDAWGRSADTNRRQAVAGLTVDPSKAGDHVGFIGTSFALGGRPGSEPWRERTRPGEPLYLTAIAASNPVFSTFVPHNLGVFSFLDDLSDSPKGPLSYHVVGWYSDPTHDIMSVAGRDVLEHLGWELPGESSDIVDRSFYCGTVFSVDPDVAWSVADPCYAPCQGEGLNVAIGNSTADAFMALLGANTEVPDDTLMLLRALQYNALDVLNQPGGDASFDEVARRSWFTSKPGGTRWSLVANATTKAASEDAALTDAEASWLEQLNVAQAEQDALLGELFFLQRRVMDRWIQKGYYDPPTSQMSPDAPVGFPTIDPQSNLDIRAALFDKLGADLDPAQGGSSAARLVATYDAVLQGEERLGIREADGPPVTAGGSLSRQYSFGENQRHVVQSTKTLKRTAAEPFHAAGDPVVIVSGVRPAHATLPEDRLVVRSGAQLIRHLSVGGRLVDAAPIGPLDGSAQLPDGVTAYLDECGLLDPNNVAGLGLAGPVDPKDTAMVGSTAVPPAYGLSGWTQPWEPMFLEWEMEHVPLAADPEGRAFWAFDGTDYVLTQEGQTAFDSISRHGAELDGNHSVSGLSLLGAQVQRLFARRLDDFLASFKGDATSDEWRSAVDEILGWKFVAQDLGGFGVQLTSRDPRPFRRPTSIDTIGTRSLAELTGFGQASGPLPGVMRGAVTSTPIVDQRRLSFDGMRQTVAWFTSLVLYDKFGRAVRVIGTTGRDDAENLDLDIHTALRGPNDGMRGRFIYMPPRLLQDARLDFDLIDADDERKIVGIQAGANPVCGFILPNHLDRSLSLYCADGRALGEFRLVEGADGTRRSEFQAVPGGAAKTLDDVRGESEHMFHMLGDDHLREAAGFNAFLDAIDATLWTVDPLGNRVDQNLSVLIGRPLALIRARLAITVDGPPLEDTGWFATGQALGLLPGRTSPLPYLAETLSVRIGDRATRHDGVIGYFESSDYSRFNAVTPPPAGQNDDYVRPIGPVGVAEGGNYLTVTSRPGDSRMLTILADPRASLHAVTGLLPVRKLTIPACFVERPLRSIAIGFRFGPILTTLTAGPQGSRPASPSQPAVTLPVPAEQGGEWTWWEPQLGKDSWTNYHVTNTVVQARLSPMQRSLRDGVLQLTVRLDGRDDTEAHSA